jgi:hypothetical protein
MLCTYFIDEPIWLNDELTSQDYSKQSYLDCDVQCSLADKGSDVRLVLTNAKLNTSNGFDGLRER